MKEKVIGLLTIGIVSAGLLTACGSSNESYSEGTGVNGNIEVGTDHSESEGVTTSQSTTEQNTESQATTVSKAVALYNGVYKKNIGDGIEITSEPFSLELREDGTALHKRDEREFEAVYKIDGENFDMDENWFGMTVHYLGTIKDGKLVIYNGSDTDTWCTEYAYEISQENS